MPSRPATDAASRSRASDRRPHPRFPGVSTAARPRQLRGRGRDAAEVTAASWKNSLAHLELNFYDYCFGGGLRFTYNLPTRRDPGVSIGLRETRLRESRKMGADRG